MAATCFDIRVDHERFSVPYTSAAVFNKLFRPYIESTSRLGTNNSGMFYNKDNGLSIEYVGFTGRGHLYNFYYSAPSLPEIDMFGVEVYQDTNIIGKKYAGRIDFYSSFYYSKDILPKEFVKLYDDCRTLFSQKKFNRTRINIAFDFDTPIFDFTKYLKKSGNSKRVEKYWNRDPATGLHNNVSYLPKDSKGYGVIYYNKKQQSKRQEKEWLYKNEGRENWFRIEYEIYSPYSSAPEEELIQSIKNKIFAGVSPKFPGIVNYKQNPEEKHNATTGVSSKFPGIVVDYKPNSEVKHNATTCVSPKFPGIVGYKPNPEVKYNVTNSYNRLSEHSKEQGVLPEYVMIDHIKEFLMDKNISEERKNNFMTLFLGFFNAMVNMFKESVNSGNTSYEDYVKQVELDRLSKIKK